MSETRRRFDPDFKDGAVRIVIETGRSIAQVARELGVNPGTLASWVALERHRQAQDGGIDQDERAELVRLRAECARLRMERDVLKRSLVLWVNEAEGR